MVILRDPGAQHTQMHMSTGRAENRHLQTGIS